LKVKRIALVHGEEDQTLAFADDLRNNGFAVVVPRKGETLNVWMRIAEWGQISPKINGHILKARVIQKPSFAWPNFRESRASSSGWLLSSVMGHEALVMMSFYSWIIKCNLKPKEGSVNFVLIADTQKWRQGRNWPCLKFSPQSGCLDGLNLPITLYIIGNNAAWSLSVSKASTRCKRFLPEKKDRWYPLSGPFSLFFNTLSDRLGIMALPVLSLLRTACYSDIRILQENPLFSSLKNAGSTHLTETIPLILLNLYPLY
jgi:hypothetical protein